MYTKETQNLLFFSEFFFLLKTNGDEKNKTL